MPASPSHHPSALRRWRGRRLHGLVGDTTRRTTGDAARY